MEGKKALLERKRVKGVEEAISRGFIKENWDRNEWHNHYMGGIPPVDTEQFEHQHVDPADLDVEDTDGAKFHEKLIEWTRGDEENCDRKQKSRMRRRKKKEEEEEEEKEEKEEKEKRNSINRFISIRDGGRTG